jgi:hypothetical protein
MADEERQDDPDHEPSDADDREVPHDEPQVPSLPTDDEDRDIAFQEREKREQPGSD